ncbi:MAG: putative toxin-antitoxin system toxin component, PIN family [Patescibacteria group bacterium]
MRLVLDTNVYIAAFLQKGLASDILILGEERKVDLFISPEIIKEIEEKLDKKFKVDKDRIGKFIDVVKRSTEQVTPFKKIYVIKVDPDDNMILECVVEAKADLIVSMDKHLLKLKSYEGTGIVHTKTLTWIIPKFFEN